jgi:hypothetical protein
MVSNDCDGVGLNVFKVFCISGVSWPFHTDEALPEVLSRDCDLVSQRNNVHRKLLQDFVVYQRRSAEGTRSDPL